MGFLSKVRHRNYFCEGLCVSVCEQLVLTSAPKAAGWVLLQDSMGGTGHWCGRDASPEVPLPS